ncbi:uncharacterized protein LOC128199887 [Bicyclus anynana]|uniref:Uncharacterized protein LOC128199887 n=1 Tax=Bicyclus anynana TaxID=110368 RepID=A0ABM3M6U1_BICAN|nr:uncharacterized protein LOC128199887 [Bicyclus anynana]
METETENFTEKPIRKIEDIIDLQKANGNINVRQVAFKLPSDTDSGLSASVAKSSETGLTNAKLEYKKKAKRLRSKLQKDLLSDVVSWPSDSDITVLRMKPHSNKGDKKMSNIILGDGPHQPDSLSMINLATLILKSQPPSKQSLVEEYLLPLTSWERAVDPNVKKPTPLNAISNISNDTRELNAYQTRYSHTDMLSHKDSDAYECDTHTKSKVAKFLRLYFCPCCTCLYNLEKMQEPCALALQSAKKNVNN